MQENSRPLLEAEETRSRARGRSIRRKRNRIWIVFVVKILLLLLLAGFEAIWVAFGSEADVMSQVGLQRMRVERLAKDVLYLKYHPSPTERTLATSEIQDTLPLWLATQRGLQVGDASLGLPRHPPADIQLLIGQSQADYIPITVALQKIAVRPTPLDTVQAQIVLDHERPYLLTIAQANMLWQQRINDTFYQLFWIEVVLIALIMALIAVNVWLTYPRPGD